MATSLKSPLCWYGGKTRLVPKLLPLVPKHQTYVEVFGGSAALFFAKDVSPLEVINDLNSGLVNFYWVLRDPEKIRKFTYLANLTPYSREEFNFCRSTWQTCKDDVKKAHRWFVVMRESFAAVGGRFGLSVTAGGAVGGYLAAIQRLPEIHKRLRHVQIENRDFRKLIQTYDRATTFFYLDPPYVLSTRKRKAYDHEMSDEDHTELVKMLLRIKGKAMLSGYANPIYEPLKRCGWKRHDFKATCATSVKFAKGGKGANLERIESVWVKP